MYKRETPFKTTHSLACFQHILPIYCYLLMCLRRVVISMNFYDFTFNFTIYACIQTNNNNTATHFVYALSIHNPHTKLYTRRDANSKFHKNTLIYGKPREAQLNCAPIFIQYGRGTRKYFSVPSQQALNIFTLPCTNKCTHSTNKPP